MIKGEIINIVFSTEDLAGWLFDYIDEGRLLKYACYKGNNTSGFFGFIEHTNQLSSANNQELLYLYLYILSK